MSTICEEAAALTAFERHCDQALAVVAPRPPVRLALAVSVPDDMTAPGPAHPAAKALSKREAT